MYGYLNTTSLWDNDWLVGRYEVYVLPRLMRQDWVIQELKDGATQKEMEDLFWKDYEEWAWRYQEEERSNL